MRNSPIDEYDDVIWSIKNISFNKIRAIANDFVSELTENEKDELWKILKRGIALLRTDAELKYYLYAYGKMHQQKMNVALSHFSWEDFENKRIQIVDWGCGQALATICFFDYLKKKDIKCEIDKIVLIEPSNEALERATIHVCAYDDYVWEETDIETINKCIDQVNLTEIESNADLTIHFFANVLDIPNINLSRLARIVKKTSDNETFVICMGPNNNFNKRIDEFFSYFHNFELLYEDEHDVTNEYDYTAKYCIFALNKKKDYFDYDDNMTVNEFFERHNVDKKLFIIKTKTNDNGEKFKVVGFANGKKDKDGHVAYTYFVLSRKIEFGSNVEIKSYLKAHKKDVRLVEPPTGYRYGILFVETEFEEWDEL